MNIMLDNPNIERCEHSNQVCLKFTFKQQLTENKAIQAIEKWKQMFESEAGKKFTLIWNCQEMTGYEPMARVIWQRAIKEMKDQIDSIWLVSDSILIQTGAKIVSLFTSFDINIVNDEAKILVN